MKRIKKLKKIILTNNFYDIEIYRLLDSRVFDSIIGSKVLKKHKLKYHELNEHLVKLLNNFVHFFKSNFKNLSPFFVMYFKT